VPMGALAAGTICKDGKIVAADGSSDPLPTPVVPTVTNPPVNTQTKVDPTEPEMTTTSFVTEATHIKMTSTIFTTVTAPVAETMTAPPAVSSVAVITSSLPVDVPSAQPSVMPTEIQAPAPSGGLLINIDQLLDIAPGSKTCDGPNTENECGTADTALPNINAAFSKYSISTIGEAAAILSIMAFESVDFKFNRNQFPGNPGQGTKAMLMPNFIIEYAQSLSISTDDIQPGLNAGNIGNQDKEIRNKVLDLVLSDDKTYGSAAWYYSAKCDDTVKTGLRGKDIKLADWTAYITGCINTTLDPEGKRQAGFKTALEALGGTLI